MLSRSRRIEIKASFQVCRLASFGLTSAIALLAGCQTVVKPIQANRYPHPQVITTRSQNEALAVAGKMCPAGGFIVRVLRTGSMYPTIDRDCFAVMKVDFAGINEGDICDEKLSPAFAAEYPPNQRSATLIHRVISRWPSKSELAWETRGDNCITNRRADPFPLVRKNYAGTAICFVTWKSAALSNRTGI